MAKRLKKPPIHRVTGAHDAPVREEEQRPVEPAQCAEKCYPHRVPGSSGALASGCFQGADEGGTSRLPPAATWE